MITLPKLLLALAAVFATAPLQAETTLLRRASSAKVIIENGTIGILQVQGVYDTRDTQGNHALVIVTTDAGYRQLTTTTQEAEGTVVIELDCLKMRVALRRPVGEPKMIFGRVTTSGKRVYVMSEAVAVDHL